MGLSAPVAFQYPFPAVRFGLEPFGYLRSRGVKKYHSLCPNNDLSAHIITKPILVPQDPGSFACEAADCIGQGGEDQRAAARSHLPVLEPIRLVSSMNFHYYYLDTVHMYELHEDKVDFGVEAA
ncbi:hypothetical protein B296_00044236 [Ensete ventricosum]|uniref:Uncharacterized protein n=1 Tax=Ensete ventricosum TaxID=4639 RepID=A0A426XG75_ENSVE|nr:hypothetical protein B296_00044236 [Ensete ventricosum]